MLGTAQDTRLAACRDVQEFLRQRIGLAKTPEETLNLRDDLEFDSLDAVELVMDLEMEYHIDIPDSALEKLNTVGDVCRLVDILTKEPS